MVLSLLYAIGLLSTFSATAWSIIDHFMPFYFAISALCITIASLANYFYYQTYHNHFDIFVFSFFDDDTKAVVSNILDDYPIIKGVIIVTLVTLCNVFLTKWQLSQTLTNTWTWYATAAVSLISILGYFILARGSIGTFPLRRENAQVSELPSLNKMTPNAFMALDWANKDRKKDVLFDDVTQQEGNILLSELFDQTEIKQTTPINPYLQQQRPHVVFSIMEGMGMNVIQFDNEENNDLLGALRPAFKEDFVFKRFVSSQNGTSPSLSFLLFNSPVSTISHSSAQNTPLIGSIYRPYKKAGYKTIFISPGNMMWRNLVNYLPLQGVDFIYDQNTLLNEYPDAKEHMTDWGLPDGYAFQYAEKLLKESQEPLFITILTVTNHPPYVTPSFYKPKVVTVTPEFEAKAGSGQIETKEILTTFQYAKNALGEFIANIKNSEIGENTLIAATGDHTLRRIQPIMPHDIVIDKAVPFYLYVPKSILEHVPYRYDDTRIGSHKDILPTLYHFSLSEQDFYNIGGRNLLEEKETTAKVFGINHNIVITHKGVITRQKPMLFYPWKNKNSLQIQKTASPASKEITQRIEQFQKLKRWWINFDVTQNQKH